MHWMFVLIHQWMINMVILNLCIGGLWMFYDFIVCILDNYGCFLALFMHMDVHGYQWHEFLHLYICLCMIFLFLPLLFEMIKKEKNYDCFIPWHRLIKFE